MNPRTQMQLPGSPPYHCYYSVSSEPRSASTVTSNGPKKIPPHVDFPTSPQSADGSAGEEVIIQHYSHPNHHLAQTTIFADLFVCGGCKEYGAGKRFSCQECNFQLHDFCALAPPTLKAHPLHPQHQLVFHSRPKQAGLSWPKCDACGKSIKGFTFRCRACSFQMHPCCAMLSTEMIFPPLPWEAHSSNGHLHSLKLLPPGTQLNISSTTSTNSSGNNNTIGAAVCGECKMKRTAGRIYRCTTCNYHLHAVCAKAMINGLRANGMTAPEKPNKSMMLGTAARLASQVVIEFIGGLIEGVGEGVGQVLVQSMARGRRRRGRAPTDRPQTS
ncbi:OLC1v1016210C1 [Oldenlandia corymbosa var. corymbosa]|uniref:OLC1v1016210C1 n=1 Tax=Oldenlandia corymbosa var. corymbosa TaxID=529605 RepID=A0AAV1E568_OLDCO|nr:OLC1v1016210C1 [Oldenlandia corymbosa var. corymbosa]